ncbi:MAG: hypothetical protein LLG42_13240 [Chloroflexi bacterium]|nr:hypothetical protein [Chloroflexota bacterium]
MLSESMYEALAADKRIQIEKGVKHNMLVHEAEKSFTGHHGSKMLVKLARLLILAGEHLMSHAERDMKTTFPNPSL